MIVYLVGYVDTTQTPPTMVGVGLSSTPVQFINSDRAKRLPVLIDELDAMTYGRALTLMFKGVCSLPAYEWLRPLMFK